MPIQRYIEGFSEYPEDIKEFTDECYLDIFPETTRELAKWEDQFLLDGKGADQERRDALSATWMAQGGQGKDYLESVIQEAGFTNVYLHEWWNSDGTTKNPNYYLKSSQSAYITFTGKPGAQTGDGVSQTANAISINDYEYFTGQLNAQSGDGTTQTAGKIIPPILYLYYTGKTRAQTGDGITQTAGQLGIPAGFLLVNKGPNIVYQVPNTLDEYREILYVGAEIFPNIAEVSIARKEEFERLLLKYLPYSYWLGLLIKYV